MTRVFVVWDESHLWGLLVLRALRALGVPHGVLRAKQIAEGALSGKRTLAAPMHDRAGSLLIAPGGWARGKAMRLGEAGLDAIRGFVSGGGAYLGFCGGAGLALSGPRPGESLGLCPWGRMGFAGRLQHFLSGGVRLALDASTPLGAALCPPAASSLTAPVWWPAQFAPPPPGQDDGSVSVLARYAGLREDFWVADLALSAIPEETLGDWQNLYGLTVRPDFLSGRPAVIAGRHGKGRYLLSYPHLETPDEAEGNAWLRHILNEMGCGPATQARPEHAIVPPWRLGREEPAWDDPALLAAKAALEEVIALGQEHLLLFWRNPWLLGWRRGIPGPGINSLYALVCEALSREPNESARACWAERSAEFSRLTELFRQGLSGLLLAERLDMTVRSTPGVDGADQVFAKNLRDMRSALFGPPPAGGGVCGQMLGMLEELCWLGWE